MIFPPNPEEYEILYQIGSNSISDLYSARCKTNNQIISVRIISMEQNNIDVANLRKAGSLWMTSSHENLSRYYGSFEVGSSLWIVSEYIDGGSIRDILRYGYNHGIRNETLISAILRPVLEFLSIFHQNMHIHRAINTDVIMLKTDGTIKISNLSFASSLIAGGKRKGALYSLSYGFDSHSSCYAAPEVLSGSGYTQSSDIWSVGITAIELATGILPYEHLTEMERIKSIIDGPPPTLRSVREAQYPSQLKLDSYSASSAKIRRSSSSYNKDTKSSGNNNNNSEFSPAFNDFIDQCLKKLPEKRPTVNRLLEHKFFKNMALNLNYNMNGNNNLNDLCKSYISRILMSQLPPLHERFDSLMNMKSSNYTIGRNASIKSAESVRGVHFADIYLAESNQNQSENYKSDRTKISSQRSVPSLTRKGNVNPSQTFDFLFSSDPRMPSIPPLNNSSSSSNASVDGNDWIFDSADLIKHQSSSLDSINEPLVAGKTEQSRNKSRAKSKNRINSDGDKIHNPGQIEIDKKDQNPEPIQVGRFKVHRISNPQSFPNNTTSDIIDIKS